MQFMPRCDMFNNHYHVINEISTQVSSGREIGNEIFVPERPIFSANSIASSSVPDYGQMQDIFPSGAGSEFLKVPEEENLNGNYFYTHLRKRINNLHPNPNYNLQKNMRSSTGRPLTAPLKDYVIHVSRKDASIPIYNKGSGSEAMVVDHHDLISSVISRSAVVRMINIIQQAAREIEEKRAKKMEKKAARLAKRKLKQQAEKEKRQQVSNPNKKNKNDPNNLKLFENSKEQEQDEKRKNNENNVPARKPERILPFHVNFNEFNVFFDRDPYLVAAFLPFIAYKQVQRCFMC